MAAPCQRIREANPSPTHTTGGRAMRFLPVLVLLALGAVVNSAAGQPAHTPRLDCNGDALPDGVIARLGTLRFQPPGHVQAAALLPDGTFVATATQIKDGTRVDLMDT